MHLKYSFIIYNAKCEKTIKKNQWNKNHSKRTSISITNRKLVRT